MHWNSFSPRTQTRVYNAASCGMPAMDCFNFSHFRSSSGRKTHQRMLSDRTRGTELKKEVKLRDLQNRCQKNEEGDCILIKQLTIGSETISGHFLTVLNCVYIKIRRSISLPLHPIHFVFQNQCVLAHRTLCSHWHMTTERCRMPL